MRTRPVDNSAYMSYLQKSQEFFNSMKRSFDAGEYNAAVSSAIHSMISAADALCVSKLGVRHAGENHDDALSLFSGLDRESHEMKKNVQRLSRVLGMKGDSEYGEILMTRKKAEMAVLDAERFISFVRARITGV